MCARQFRKINFKDEEEKKWAEGCLANAFASAVVKRESPSKRPRGPDCMQYCISVALNVMAEEKKVFLALACPIETQKHVPKYTTHKYVQCIQRRADSWILWKRG